MASESVGHAFLVSFPGQGHVNPLLRLGKRLASRGLLVTFSAPEYIGRVMRKASDMNNEPIPVGTGFIRFEFFSDGWGEDEPRRYDLDVYLTQLEFVGGDLLPKMLKRHAEEGRPVTCLINNPFIPWVSDVADTLRIPNAMLWVQSCACFSAYYHYFHQIVPFPNETDTEIEVQLPFMPLLKHDEIPSFLYPTTPYPFLRRAILGQYKNLSKPFCVLMDTFHELEQDVIEYMSKLCPIKPVGPLFKDPKARDSNVRGDFIKAADDCIEWLDSKPLSSVVYISFGSVVYLKQEQVDEIAFGLLGSEVSFLWVMRPTIEGQSGLEPLVLPEGFLERAGETGRIVQWSPQERVLAHESVACFVTHCGWNSTMEALSSGVPVVAFPQWGDQVTDAKYLVDVFRVGVRMCRGEAEGRVVRRDEVERCLREATGGEVAAEIKRNALEWKRAAEEAVAEGGSSDRNMQDFVDEVMRRSLGVTVKSAPTV
ncbi:UDP-Glycosyltransferase superfamily protein [Actinidia rufa]|uniref:Glycosyltransferase n=1 Tax=Actinidia rufa TaxID=165716 RepID=A0A7J0DQ57_9ERIC|nr:UDP-Glycosyltransferase superfamily protein [Actinidia rufa]